MTWKETYEAVVEEQIREQEGWIEATGDVTDPGDLGILVTITDCLQTGDEALAQELLVVLAKSLADGGITEAKEVGRDLEQEGDGS